MIFTYFLSQSAHWSLRGLLGSQMLILARKWSTVWPPVEKLIFLATRFPLLTHTHLYLHTLARAR